MKYIHPKIIAAGVLPVCYKTGRILLGRRGMHQTEPGLWGCFGGRLDKHDKTMKTTAIREFGEETMYKGKFQITKMPFYTFTNNHVIFHYYLGIFEEEFTPDILTAGEAMDYGWFRMNALPEAFQTGFEEMLQTKGPLLDALIKNLQAKCL